MKTFQLSAVIALLILLMSFSFGTVDKKYHVPAGTYFGGGEDIENPVVKLIINTDKTFAFVDRSNPNQIIDVKGSWKYTQGKLSLSSKDGQVRFHNKWRLDTTCNCLKSRKGMTIYRICM